MWAGEVDIVGKNKGLYQQFFKADGLQKAVHRLTCPKICFIYFFLKLKHLKENDKTKLRPEKNTLPSLLIQETVRYEV